MCRIATVALTPQHQASGIARRFLTQTLTAWAVDVDGIDSALLLTSEVVTNAVLHAQTASTLTVALSGDCLEIAVQDAGDGQPTRRRSPQDATEHRPTETTDPLAESGRGMLLIAAIADTWGVQALPEGKQVWFRLSVQRTSGAHQHCTCQDETVHGVILGSGARAVHRAA